MTVQFKLEEVELELEEPPKKLMLEIRNALPKISKMCYKSYIKKEEVEIIIFTLWYHRQTNLVQSEHYTVTSNEVQIGEFRHSDGVTIQLENLTFPRNLFKLFNFFFVRTFFL